MSAVLGDLSVNGKLIMIGASNETVGVPLLLFISGRRSIVGCLAARQLIHKIRSISVCF
jgi:hypothetical protein